MRNIAIVVLSVISAAAIIFGSVLYNKQLDASDALLVSEKSVSDLNKKVAQLNQETSALQDKIRNKNKQLVKLENTLKVKDQRLVELPALQDKIHYKNKQLVKLGDIIKAKNQMISELKEGIHALEKDLKEERKAKDAIFTDLQERLQGSQSHIRYLEEEVAKGHNETQGLQSQLINLKGQKTLAETNKGHLKATYEALIKDLKKEIKKKEVTIKEFENQISVTFVDRILFEFGKSTITSEGEKILEKVGEILRDIQGKRIRIVGHADNIPILPQYRYKFPTNWELSGARSSAVIRYFIKSIHLDPRNMEAVSRSFHDPIASNETSEGRAQNRRVEIIISPQLG